jgi:ABC-type polysaccharide/polyol phosphate export permease
MSSKRASRTWGGDIVFLIENLVLKDFRIRYRNMSLGILWSLINPLVMMGVLTFVFTHLIGDRGHVAYPLFFLCGLVPYNFFAGALISGTTSVVDSANLVKRVPVPREVVPIAAVLSNCVHLMIQVVLLLAIALLFHLRPGMHWLWLPLIWILYIAFVCGLALGASAINVFIRDTRYVVESFNLLLFWMVPIVYSFGDISSSDISSKYAFVYHYNPVAAAIMATRNILIDGRSPSASLLENMVIVAAVSLGLGLLIFARLKPRFYEHI